MGSNNVYGRLREPYQVFAVNPNTGQVEGDRCHPGLASISGGLQAVVIGTRPEIAEGTMCEFAELGIKQVWIRGPAARGARRRRKALATLGARGNYDEPARDPGRAVRGGR
jgi:uncharacterized protein